MEAAIAGVLAFLGIGGGSAPGSHARADFGDHWGLVVALNVVNTVIVVFYVWRIWRQKLPPILRRTK